MALSVNNRPGSEAQFHTMPVIGVEKNGRQAMTGPQRRTATRPYKSLQRCHFLA
jgi:hypothetical protein